MVILNISIFRYVGPLSYVLLWAPLDMHTVGLLLLVDTLRAHVLLIDFFMHMNICWESWPSQYMISFPVVLRLRWLDPPRKWCHTHLEGSSC